MNRQIKTVKELKKLALNKTLECYILLFKSIRSSKQISYNKKEKWYILNEIDDTTNFYKTDKKFKQKYPLFFKAMKTGNLYRY